MTFVDEPVPYVSQGCYTDDTGSRALTGARFNDDNMSIDTCANICAGWSLFGIEYDISLVKQ